jgi:hypothetical protein
MIESTDRVASVRRRSSGLKFLNDSYVTTSYFLPMLGGRRERFLRGFGRSAPRRSFSRASIRTCWFSG